MLQTNFFQCLLAAVCLFRLTLCNCDSPPEALATKETDFAIGPLHGSVIDALLGVKPCRGEAILRSRCRSARLLSVIESSLQTVAAQYFPTRFSSFRSIQFEGHLPKENKL